MAQLLQLTDTNFILSYEQTQFITLIGHIGDINRAIAKQIVAAPNISKKYVILSQSNSNKRVIMLYVWVHVIPTQPQILLISQIKVIRTGWTRPKYKLSTTIQCTSTYSLMSSCKGFENTTK